MTVGTRIRKLREEFGISQLELSEKLKINNRVLSRIELDDRSVRDEELILFADFFDVSVDYILGRTCVRKQVDTSTAHTDDDMSDEAKSELENFKQYLKSKYSK